MCHSMPDELRESDSMYDNETRQSEGNQIIANDSDMNMDVNILRTPPKDIDGGMND